MPVRVNTKISDRANEWLDKKSKEMALSKSALVNVAVENYISLKGGGKDGNRECKCINNA